MTNQNNNYVDPNWNPENPARQSINRVDGTTINFVQVGPFRWKPDFDWIAASTSTGKK